MNVLYLFESHQVREFLGLTLDAASESDKPTAWSADGRLSRRHVDYDSCDGGFFLYADIGKRILNDLSWHHLQVLRLHNRKLEEGLRVAQ